MKQYDYLIVGAGLYGAVFAHEAKKAGKRCLVIDKRDHIAGNIYTEPVEGINVHRYGAHIFHTNNKAVWQYVNQFAEFNRYTNSPVANYHGEIYNMPFNMNTFNKMWGVVTPAEAKAKIEQQKAEAGITEPKKPRRTGHQPCGHRHLREAGQGLHRQAVGPPLHRAARLHHQASARPLYLRQQLLQRPLSGHPQRRLHRHGGKDAGRRGSPPECGLSGREGAAGQTGRQGRLHRPGGRLFRLQAGGFAVPQRPVRDGSPRHRQLSGQRRRELHRRREPPYTRIIEHKHFEFGTQPKTVISREYSAEWKKGDEPYYPVNDEKNGALYAEYKKLADAEPGVIFGGRLGEYKYYDMDKVIEVALSVAEKELA